MLYLQSMTIVEHDMSLAPAWAERITVRKHGDAVTVSGVNRIASLPVHHELHDGTKDFVEQYRTAGRVVWGQKRTAGRVGLHIDFANADTDSKLMAFVRTNGPVWGNLPTYRNSRTEKRRIDSISVEESLAG